MAESFNLSHLVESFFSRQPEVLRGVIKIGYDKQGQLTFTPGDGSPPMKSWTQAQRHVQNTSLSNAYSFSTTDLRRGARPLQGHPMIRDLMMDWAKKGKGKKQPIHQVMINIFDFETSSQSEIMRQRILKAGTGAYFGDAEQGYFLQFFRGGVAQKTEDVYKFLERSQGLAFNKMSGKLFKRLKGLFADQQFSGRIAPITVSVRDSSTLMDMSHLKDELMGHIRTGKMTEKDAVAVLAEAAKRADDGWSEVSLGVVEDLHDDYRRQIKSLKTKGMKNDPATQKRILELTQKRAELGKHIKDAKEGRIGAIFNLRASGGRIDLDPLRSRIQEIDRELTNLKRTVIPTQAQQLEAATLRRTKKEIQEELRRLKNVKAWMSKGDVRINISIPGRQIVTGVGNVTAEMGRDLTGLKKKRRVTDISLSERTGKATRTDIQSIMSHPKFFNTRFLEEMQEEELKRFTRMMEQLDQGKMPGAIKKIVESQLSSKDPKVVRKAMEIKRIFDSPYLSLADNPNLREYVVNTIRDSFFVTKKGIKYGKMRIPASMSGYMVPLHGLRDIDPKLLALGPGQTRMVGGVWAFTPEMMVKGYAALGGPDFDDSVNGFTTWLSKGRGHFELRNVFTRSPTDISEVFFAGKNFDDSSLRGPLKKAGLLKDYKAVTRLITRTEESIESLRRGLDGSGNDIYLKRLIRRREKRLSSMIGQRNDMLRRSIPAFRDFGARRGFEGDEFVYSDDMFETIAADDPRIALRGERVFTGRKLIEITKEKDKVYSYAGTPHQRFLAIQAGETPLDMKGISKLTKLEPDEFKKAVHFLAGGLDFLDNAAGIQRTASLGSWANSKMWAAHWFETHTNKMIKAGLGDVLHQVFLEQEQIIDLIKQSGVDAARNAEKILQLQDTFLRNTIKAALVGYEHGLDVKFDPVASEMLKKAPDTALIREVIAEHRDDALRRGVPESRIVRDWSDLLMDEADKRASVAKYMDFRRQVEEAAKAQNAMTTTRFSPTVLKGEIADNIRKSHQATRDAESMINAYRRRSDALLKELQGFEGIPNTEFLKTRFDVMASDLLSSVTDLFDTHPSGERAAGDRAHRAIIRLMQLAEAGRISPYALEGLEQFGLTNDAVLYARGALFSERDRVAAEMAKRGETYVPMTARRIQDEIGTMTSRAMRAPLESILGDSFGFFETIDEGMHAASKYAEEIIPEELGRRIGDVEGTARFVGARGGQLSSFLSPETKVEIPGFKKRKAQTKSLASWLIERERRGGSGYGRHIEESLRTGFEHVRQTFMDETSGVKQLDPGLGRVVATAIEAEAPGSATAQALRDSADAATKVAGQIDQKTGLVNMMRDLWSHKSIRRPVSIAAGVLAAAGLVRTFSNRDRTLEDMQGPSHMPGGNPYDMSGGKETPDATFTGSPPYNPSGGGTSYVVRTRGGSNHNAFLSMIGSITGANVDSSTYDAPEMPFRSESARQRILAEYR